MGNTHWVGMAGMHGCMPNCVTWGETRTEAARSLGSILDIGKRRQAELVKNHILELNLEKEGNEYAELMECNCADPEVTHQD